MRAKFRVIIGTKKAKIGLIDLEICATMNYFFLPVPRSVLGSVIPCRITLPSGFHAFSVSLTYHLWSHEIDPHHTALILPYLSHGHHQRDELTDLPIIYHSFLSFLTQVSQGNKEPY